MSVGPGIYYDMTWEDYAALPYLSQSTLKLMDRDAAYGATPLHAKAAFDKRLDDDDTQTLRLGRAEHAWITEGETAFRKRFVVAPAKCAETTKPKSKTEEGKPCSNSPTCMDDAERWLCGVHAKGKEVSTPADYITADHLERIKAMSEAVRSHEINRHLTRKGWSECTIVYDVPVPFALQKCRECDAVGSCMKLGFERWRCRICSREMPGPKYEHAIRTLRHKVRIDRLAEPSQTFPHLIADLKRMQLMEGRRFKRQDTIKNYGWQIQAAMYTEAVRVHFGVSRCHYIWLFVEEKYPHDVSWLPASDEALTIGADALWRYRAEWAACETSGVWPGYCVGNQEPGGLNDGFIREYRKRHGDENGKLAAERAGLDAGED